MKFKLTIFAALLFSAAIQAAELEDELFKDPATSEGTQVILGIADLALADFVSGVRKTGATDPRVVALEDANKAVRRAHGMMTQEVKTARIAELSKLIEQAKSVEDNVEKVNELIEEVQQLSKMAATTDQAKGAAIESAEKGLAEARETLLKSGKGIKGPGFISKSIRAVRVIGGSVFILDILGRIYVWNALDRNPGFFPAGKVMAHYGGKAYDELKSAGFFDRLYGTRDGQAEKVETRNESRNH